MDNKLNIKLIKLKECLKSKGSLAIAFSGGVDSTLLLKVAHDTLGDGVLAVTASSGAFPARELREAVNFCEEEGIRQVVLDVRDRQAECFADNPPNRCYFCKKAVFTGICEIAEAHGIGCVAEGSNMDDMGDYRPGLAAVAELGILSPLREADLYKEEIRILCREMKLAVWQKPSCACLASRFVYGEAITPEKLAMVESAEEFLLSCGFVQTRVRVHGSLARIEVLPEEAGRLVEPDMRRRVAEKLKECGFSYVTMDMQGYRTGSMNETLEIKR